MKRLINHLLKENTEQILNRSLLNCHIQGLHSIMLLECPGKTIRLYITDEWHNLTDGALAIHAHHCNLRLIQVYGEMTNYIYGDKYEYKQFDNHSSWYNKFIYESAIKSEDKTAKFNRDGGSHLYLNDTVLLQKGSEYYMKADVCHTVSVELNKKSAWIVLEGEEDINYKSVLYSKKNDIKMEGDFYIKPTLYEIKLLLNSVDLIIK